MLLPQFKTLLTCDRHRGRAPSPAAEGRGPMQKQRVEEREAGVTGWARGVSQRRRAGHCCRGGREFFGFLFFFFLPEKKKEKRKRKRKRK